MNPRRPWRWVGVAGVLALAGLAAATLWPQQPGSSAWQAEPASNLGAPVPSGSASVPRAAPGTTGASAAARGASHPPDVAHAAPPPGVTPAQWAALRDELAHRPGGAAELQRLDAYFRYADAALRLRQLRAAQPAAPELPALARTVEQGLAQRLQHNEVSFAEARQLKLAALEVLQPDPALRQAQLDQWLAAQRAGPATGGASAHEAAFQQRQAALVAQWSALPAAQRDPRQLEQQLEALRRTSFPAPGH